MYLTQTTQDFNAAGPNRPIAKDGGPTLRREFLQLGAELFNRGQRPVAEFVSELADLAPEVVAEIQVRLEAYCRIPAETYQALGADVFTPFLVGIPGGRP